MDMRLACRPDPPSNKDRKFEQIKSALRERESLTNLAGDEHILVEKTPISNQLNLGSCVANAWCDMLEILMGLDGLTVVQLSRLYLYWIARSLTADTDKDEGTFLRAAAQQIRTLGVCPEEYWPYDTTQVFVAPNLECTTMASDNKLSGFYRIDSVGDQRVTEIELAIRSNHPVAYGTAVGKEFQQYAGGGQVLHPPSVTLGRHAMIWTGVKRDGNSKLFLVRNSWGTGWGDNGHAWMHEDYIKSDDTQDIWVGTQLSPILI